MRVPNHKLDGYFARREVVENYNNTVQAVMDDEGRYSVYHWGLMVVQVGSDGSFWAVPNFISQTTATLIGRAMRSQDRNEVTKWVETEFLLGKIDARRRRQLLKQLW